MGFGGAARDVVGLMSTKTHDRVGQSVPSHPFAECTAELCHAAQISPEAEPYAVTGTRHVIHVIRLVTHLKS